MFELSASVLRITLAATEPLEVERHPGSSLRGALYEALLRRFCMNREAPTCADCSLNATCPVAGLVAPLRDERPRGRDVPRPFVISAEAYGGVGHDPRPLHWLLPPGATLTFTLTLFGQALAYFPYLALSLALLEQMGLGRPLRVNQGRRGKARLVGVTALNPFTGEEEMLFTEGERSVRKPTLGVTGQSVAARAVTLPTDTLTLHFATPTRLVAEGRIVAQPEMRVLATRLVERLEALEREYAEPQPSAGLSEAEAHALRRERYLAVERAASAVRLVADTTRWIDLTSHSARQRRALPIGGFVGQATYAGDLSALRELLVWGEIVHVGKSAVKGDGHYWIEPQPSQAVTALGGAEAVASAAHGCPADAPGANEPSRTDATMGGAPPSPIASEV